MVSKHGLGALLYLAIQGRGSPKSISERIGANTDYLRNVIQDLLTDGYIRKPFRGHYHIEPAGIEKVLEETGLTSTDLLCARLIESDFGDDAIIGTAEEMVVRFANDTLVIYRVGYDEVPGDGVGPALSFEPSYAETVEGIRERIDAAYPEL